MKRTAYLLLLFLLTPTIAWAHSDHLTILHFNDLHGHLESEPGSGGAPVGGAARIAHIVRAIEAENRAKGWDTIVLFGGDAFSGTVFTTEFHGEAEFAFLKALRTNAMVIGNHEFDLGQPRLRELMQQMDLPILSANIYLDHKKNRFAAPDTVLTLDDGLRVALLGLTLVATPRTQQPDNVAGLTFADFKTEAKQELPKLAKRSDLVIALTHEGVANDVALAKSVKDFAAIVGGHDHVKPEQYCQDVNAVPVCETPAEGLYVGRIDLDLSNKKARSEGWKLIPVTAETPEDPEIAALVETYAKQIRAKYDVVLGRASADLPHGQSKSFALGTLIAEAIRTQTHADAAFINSSGIRAPIHKGKITLRDVNAVLPFANKLIVLDLSGEELLRTMQHAIHGKGSFPQVAGLDFEMAGDDLVAIKIKGKRIEPNEHYHIATVDFIASGSGGYESLKKIPEERKHPTDVLISDAFAQFIRKQKVLKAH